MGVARKLRLSYDLSESTPVYGGRQGPTIRQSTSIASGDSSNSLWFGCSNHHGTHIDCPRHFDDAGLRVADYSADFWFMNRVGVIYMDYAPPAGHLIHAEELEELVAVSSIPDDIEALIVKTGWAEKRHLPVYIHEGPGLEAGIPDMLRRRFSSLRILGFDLLSVTSFMHREHGRDAHRAFLKDQRPVLAVEDADLRELKKGMQLSSLVVSPFFIEGADSAPVTIWADLIE